MVLINQFINFKIGGVTVSANSTELNYNAGVIGGIAVAGKTLVLDGSKDISGINSLSATTLTGTLSTASQPNITSLGTLSALTISGHFINGSPGSGLLSVIPSGNNMYFQPSIDQSVGSATHLFITNYGLNTSNSTRVFGVMSDGRIGVQSTNPSKQMEINSSTGNNLRLTYNNMNGTATDYTDFSTDNSGDLTITTSGDYVKIAKKLLVEDVISNFKEGGLVIRSLDSPDFEGQTIKQEIITSLNILNYNPEGLIDNYSLEIYGYIKPLYSQTYTFYVGHDDSLRLFVNGELLYNYWSSGSVTNITTNTISLTGNVWYPIYIQHSEYTSGQKIQVEWESTTQIREFIPSAKMAFDGIQPAVKNKFSTGDKLTIFSNNTLTNIKKVELRVDTSGNLIIYPDGNTFNEGSLTIDTTKTKAFLVRKNADGGDIFVVDTFNSKVGINTSSPVCSLNVSSSDGQCAKFERSTVSGGTFIEVQNQAGTRCLIGPDGTGFGNGSTSDVIVSNWSNGGLHLVTNATKRLSITSNGNVGIGTDSPSNKLHIVGSNGNLLQVESTLSTGRSTILLATNGNDWEVGARAGSDATAPNSFFLHSVGDYKMIIDSDGNMGLKGQTDPDAFLDFGPNASDRTLLLFNNGSAVYGFGASNSTLKYQTGSNSDHAWYTGSTSSSTGTELMRLDSGGKLGIGIAAPTNILHVESSDLNLVRFRCTAVDKGAYMEINNQAGTRCLIGPDGGSFFGGSVSDVLVANWSNGGLHLLTNTQKRLSILNNGLVGIGTTSPINQLDIQNTGGNCDIRILRTDSNGMDFRLKSQDDKARITFEGSTGDLIIDRDNTGTLLMMMKGDGKIGFNTSAPDKQVEINSSSGDCLRLTYNDTNGSATNYCDFEVSNVGNLIVTTSGDSTDLNTRIVIDRSHQEALLVRKNGDGGDIFIVDTSNSIIHSKALLYIGSDNLTDEKRIHFTGTTGDIDINDSVISSRIYANTEDSELLLFKGNDIEGISGPDRIRMRAANFVVQTYTIGESYDTIGDDNTRLIIRQSGNVGISTTDPNKQLEVNSTTGDCLRLTYNNNNGTGGNHADFSIDVTGELSIEASSNRIKLGDTTGADGMLRVYPSGGILYLQVSNNTTTGNAADLFIGNYDNSVNNSDRKIMFKDSGKMGIGTYAPDKQLEINSSTGDCLRLTYNDSDGGATAYCDLKVSSGGDFTIFPAGNTFNEGTFTIDTTRADAFLVRKNVNSGDIFIVNTTDGRVGVNTSSPSAALHIIESNIGNTQIAKLVSTKVGGGGFLEIQNGTGTRCLIGPDGNGFFGGSTSDVIISNWSNGNLHLLTNALKRVTINSSGKVGVGLESPDSQFHIKQISQNHSGGFKTTRSDGTNNWAWFISPGDGLDFAYNGAVKAYLSESSAVDQIDFTGQHRSSTDNADINNNINNYIGLIVSSTGEYNNLNGGELNINEALPKVDLSNTDKDKKVYGIISNREDDGDRTYTQGSFVSVIGKNNGDERLIINSVGEGMIWICDKDEIIENGDLITSCTAAGYGCKQDNEFICNYTVGKITQDCDFSSPERYINLEGERINESTYNSNTDNGYKCCFVGCVYYCG